MSEWKQLNFGKSNRCCKKNKARELQLRLAVPVVPKGGWRPRRQRLPCSTGAPSQHQHAGPHVLGQREHPLGGKAEMRLSLKGLPMEGVPVPEELSRQ